MPDEDTDSGNLQIRYDKLKAQKESLEAELSRARNTHEKRSQKSQETISNLQHDMRNLNLNHESATVLLKAGVNDDSIIDFIKHTYSNTKAPEGEEKPTFAEFFDDFKETSSLMKRPAAAPVVPEVKKEEVSGKPKEPVTDSSLETTQTPAPLDVGRMSPRDFAKLSPEDQDAMFVKMGMKRG